VIKIAAFGKCKAMQLFVKYFRNMAGGFFNALPYIACSLLSIVKCAIKKTIDALFISQVFFVVS
jgi:hypothetical protein